MIETFNTIVALGALILGVISVLLIVTAVADKKSQVISFVRDNANLLIFFVSIGAMAVSIIYSNGFGYTPCYLCWFQRIFLYPTVFISGLALYKKDRNVLSYLETLTWVGIVISIYHNITYYTNTSPLPCDAAASCNMQYVSVFGFMSIPLMSAISFLAILTILRIARMK